MRRWLELILGEDERLEGWLFHIKKGERMGIQDLEEESQEGLRGLKERETGTIPGGVDVGESISLRISFRRGSTTKVINRGLYAAAIEANNQWRKRE